MADTVEKLSVQATAQMGESILEMEAPRVEVPPITQGLTFRKAEQGALQGELEQELQGALEAVRAERLAQQGLMARHLVAVAVEGEPVKAAPAAQGR